jgi:hypothetical protein
MQLLVIQFTINVFHLYTRHIRDITFIHPFIKVHIYYGLQLRWSRGSMLAFSAQVHEFKPGRSRRIFKGEKFLITPSFGGEVKPSVPCRRFAACKRTLMAWIETSCRQNYRTFLDHSSTFRCWRHLAEKVGTSKRGGKQWQTTPKNLPRMQCTRAILVAWLGSGSCPNWLNTDYYYVCVERLQWSRSSVLAFSTQVRGFKPGWSCPIFKGEKILSMPSFGGEVKPSVPCRRFAACKRSLMGWIETSCRQNYRTTFLAHSSTFRR